MKIVDRIDVSRFILNKWIAVIDAITTEEGMFLSKHGAMKLSEELILSLDTFNNLVKDEEELVNEQ